MLDMARYLQSMTRQRIAQLANNAKGLCAYCKNALHPGSKALCWHHLTKLRIRQRKAGGHDPHYKSGRGRPAITRTPAPEQSELGK